MFITPDLILKRISHSLEHTVTPEIESDFIRGQVLAAIFLLDQLTDRIEYKSDLLRMEIETNCATMEKIVSILEEKKIVVPDEIKTSLNKQNDDYNVNLDARKQYDNIFSNIIKLFYANKEKLDDETCFEIKNLMIDNFEKINLRDMSLMKLSTGPKLVQKKD